VITKQNTSERESRVKDISTLRLPALIHSHTLTEYVFISGKALKKPIARINVRSAVIPIDPAPIKPAIFLLSLWPKRASMRKLRKGMAGIRAIIVDILYFKIV
jgi:hypothetical protein